MKKLKLSFPVLCLFFLLSFPLIVLAEERKELVMPLAKDYQEANFTFEFQDSQLHKIKITTPSGGVVEKESEAESVLMTVNDASSGNYIVEITAENEIKVDVRVECISGTVTETPDLPSVEKQFSNLSINFLDGNLVVTWADNGIGKVNISVTNPKSMQKLTSEVVDGTEFTYELSSDIDEVEVFLVPATEAKIDGAGVTYTVPVVRSVAGELEVPESGITNAQAFPVSVSIREPMTLKVVDNGDIIYNEKIKESGTFNVTLPGVNNKITVYLIDEKGNGISKSFDITKDVIAPTLTLASNYDGATVKSNVEKIQIKGTVKNAQTLYINNEVVEIGADGTFEQELSLGFGENEIIVCAVDEAGNEAMNTVIISRLQGGGNKGNIIKLVAIGVVILFVILIVFLLTKRKPHTNIEKKSKTKEAVVEQKEKAPIKEDKKAKENTAAFTSKSLEFYDSETYKKLKSRYSTKRYLAFLVLLFVLFGGATLILTKVLIVTNSMSGSMEPTIMTGDKGIYNRLAYKFHPVERGDIIMFWSAEEGKLMGKRVIGLPGDELSFENGYVYINGLRAIESYIPEEVETNCSKSFCVPEGCVFVLGDNREDSIDSRFFVNPYIPMSDIKGKYCGRLKKAK